MILKIVVVATIVALVTAQDFDYDDDPRPRPAPPRIRTGYSGPSNQGNKPTPVPILKQINRHNEDGSYTYGYESADGSFKIETKLPTGEVKGKYGFVDDVGKVRVVEYGATKYGFEPQGEGITVPPPTLVDETTLKNGDPNPEYYDNYAPQPPRLPQISRPKPRPQPAYNSFSSPLQFAPAPQRTSASPAPSRPSQFSGASLTTDIDFNIPQSRPAPRPKSFRPAPSSFSFEPAPIEEEDNYAEPIPAPRPAPPKSFSPPPTRSFEPLPSFGPPSRPSPQQFPRPAPSPPQHFAPVPRPNPVTRQSGGGGGILDQLAKDYALPQSAPALHDISFGYY